MEVTRASTGARKAGRGCVGMYEPGMPALDNAVETSGFELETVSDKMHQGG